MKPMTVHFSSTTKVTLIATTASGEVEEKEIVVPKHQKDGVFQRIWEDNPLVHRLQVKAKSGNILFDKTR